MAMFFFHIHNSSLGIKLHIVLPRCWPRSQHLSEIEILLSEALEPYPYLLWKASGSFVQYLQSEPIWAWAGIGTLTDAPQPNGSIHVGRAWMSGLPVPGSKSDTTLSLVPCVWRTAAGYLHTLFFVGGRPSCMTFEHQPDARFKRTNVIVRLD